MTDIDNVDQDEGWVELSVLKKEREWITQLEAENTVLRTRIIELEAQVKQLSDEGYECPKCYSHDICHNLVYGSFECQECLHQWDEEE